MKIGNGGHMLAELMVAVVLFSVAMAAMAAFQQTFIANESSSMNVAALENGASLIGRAVGKAFEGGTYVAQPAQGSTDHLLVGQNVDPSDGASALDPSKQRTFQYLCVDPEHTLYLYQGAWPISAIQCGGGCSGNCSSRSAIARGVAPYFYRSGNNSVQINYTLTIQPTGKPAQSVSYGTQMNIPGSLE